MSPVRRLGPYQLLHKIGSGGMAEVWSARRSASPGDPPVAIKLLAAHLAERREYREMFLGEARLSMQLSHPNIVRVLDAVAHDADCYMVMELVSGMTLSQLERSLARDGERLPLGVAAYVVGELLRALAYAHQVRTAEGSVIVHRDVSPQNVMVTSDGQVKLMDFGIARFASEETQGAFVKGKLQYMPPEQLRKQTRKPTVDLYAVGAILHELIDGQRFRGRRDQVELLQMVTRGEVPPLREPDRVPAQIEVVRAGLLEADEQARIQTARHALGMLCRWGDYREASAELRALVRRYIDPSSGTLPEGSKVSSVPEGSFSGLAGLDYGPSTGRDEPILTVATVDVQTASEGDARPASRLDEEPEPTSAAEVVPPIQVAPIVAGGRGRAPRVILAGVAAALAVGVLALTLGRGDATDSPRATAEPALATAGGPTAQVAARPPAPPSTPGPTPSAAVPPSGEAEPAPEVEPASEAEPAAEAEPVTPAPEAEPASDTPEPAATAKVAVEFVANEFFFVYVKVGGKVLTLEPRARVELRAGKHTVYLRQSPDADWVRAGRITLEPGVEYRVEMRKPAGLALVKP